jgi:hypothetical protein
MTSSIAQGRVAFRDHFKMELKELKKDPALNERLTTEVCSVLAALAADKESIEVEGHEFNLSSLEQKDLFPLMKLATKLFSSKQDNILDSSLLDDLYTIEKRYHLGGMAQRAEAALTISNEPDFKLQDTQGTKAVKAQIANTNEYLKKAEKHRTIAKILTIACVASVVVGAGILALGVTLATGGAAAFAIGLTMLFFGVAGASIVPFGISKIEVNDIKQQHTYWTYILTFSQTDEFKRYQELQRENVVNTDSLKFLEAAALVHLKNNDILTPTRRWSDYSSEEARLSALEKELGPDFQEQNLYYAHSKSDDYAEIMERYDPKFYSDPDFMKFAYLKSLNHPSKTQSSKLKELKEKFEPEQVT